MRAPGNVPRKSCRPGAASARSFYVSRQLIATLSNRRRLVARRERDRGNRAARPVAGPRAQHQDGPFLVSFSARDAVTCGTADALLFGTCTSLGPLLPPWEYVEAVVRGSPARALVACANGCFLIESSGTKDVAPEGVPDGRALVENLHGVDLIVHSTRAHHSGTIYRLASNALLVGPDDFDEQVAQLRAELKIPPLSGRGTLVATTSFSISRSLLDLDLAGVRLSPEQVASLGDRSLRATLQPMERWQLPERQLTVSVVMQPSPGEARGGTLSQSNLKPFLLKGANLGVKTGVQAPPFRTLRPGETSSSLGDQLHRIVEGGVRALLNRTAGDPTQAGLDAFTRECSAAIQQGVNAGALFQAPVRVTVQGELILSRGDTVRLPTGAPVVVPDYALHEDDPRICAFTGVLVALNLRASFHPWRQARQGISLGT